MRLWESEFKLVGWLSQVAEREERVYEYRIEAVFQPLLSLNNTNITSCDYPTRQLVVKRVIDDVLVYAQVCNHTTLYNATIYGVYVMIQTRIRFVSEIYALNALWALAMLSMCCAHRENALNTLCMISTGWEQ